MLPVFHLLVSVTDEVLITLSIYSTKNSYITQHTHLYCSNFSYHFCCHKFITITEFIFV